MWVSKTGTSHGPLGWVMTDMKIVMCYMQYVMCYMQYVIHYVQDGQTCRLA